MTTEEQPIGLENVEESTERVENRRAHAALVEELIELREKVSKHSHYIETLTGLLILTWGWILASRVPSLL
jgi:hypothetical protein